MNRRLARLRSRIAGLKAGAALFLAFAAAPALAHVHGQSIAADISSVRVARGPEPRYGRPAEPLLVHVHGLFFATDGGALIVPGHTGIATFRDGSWSEVDGPIHDFAGFSLTAKAMVASGHPPPDSTLPNPLGLVKSVDGGKTWHSLALGREADFHLIAAGYRSNAIYVVNSAPNRAMPSPGLYLTKDEGKSWRRAAARGLEGEILGLSAHPLLVETIAAATTRGLYLSQDSGDQFRRMDGRQAVTAAAFDMDARSIRYARAVRREMIVASLDGKARTLVQLPPIGLDYVTHIAQHPSNARSLAIATDRRHVYLSSDAGVTWRQIAKDGDLP